VQVELLSRGKTFEKKYIALWPDTNEVSMLSDRIFLPLMEQHAPVLERLLGFVEKLRQTICAMTGSASDGKMYAVTTLEQEFREIRSQVEFEELMDSVNAAKEDFRLVRDAISIVFQNIEDGASNLLFTGDIRKEYMEKIAENYDGKLPLHEEYWCIKVPHHGTVSHYFDFSPYKPENLLISNGIFHSVGKRQAKAARTSTEYAGLFHTWDVTVWCSDDRCCDGCRDGCSCKECEIISPRAYLDIR
jgi:hypothetical protein